MEKFVTNREAVTRTLDQYRKNRENVPKDQLNGRYKEAYTNLKDRLRAEVESYLLPALIAGIRIRDTRAGWEIVDRINKMLSEDGYGKRIGKAIFKEYSLENAEGITVAENDKIYTQIYLPYLQEEKAEKEA